jgi:glycosyltransferase involved in cell wall biosynthesis
MDWFPDRPGGLNRYFYGLVHALPNVGVGGQAMVSHLSRQNLGLENSSPHLDVVPMAAEGAGLLSKWHGARHIVRSALQRGINLVNVHFAMYAFPWVRMLPPNVPLVMSFHGPWADEIGAEASTRSPKPMLARMIELTVYRRATRLITLSHAFAKILEEGYRIPSDRIRVVRGALDLKAYFEAPDRVEARERLGWPKDRPILLSVRRLVRRMGLETLIDAMCEVRRRHPDVMLLIGGTGALVNDLSARIRDADLADNVRLLGLVPEKDLPTAYAAADVSIVPSTKLEGFGLVTTESLGSGTPVLGTPIGGTPEILHGLDPSLIFESTSTQALADRIIAVLSGRVRLPSSEQCRSYAALFDWQQVAPCIRAVYEEAMGVAGVGCCQNTGTNRISVN